jgi:hypothetical protein
MKDLPFGGKAGGLAPDTTPTNMQQKAGAIMQKNIQRKPSTYLFRGLLRFFLALVTVFGSLYLGLLALTILMRQKAVNDKVRLLSKKGNAFARKIAGTRWGSLYFNLSTLKHIGRSSGREYVTPLAAYPLGDGFVFALAYGPDVDWCRNIMASGKCTLIWKGQEYALERPEIIPISEAWEAYSPSVRLFIRAGGMKQCLWVHKQSVVPEQEGVLGQPASS